MSLYRVKFGVNNPWRDGAIVDEVIALYRTLTPGQRVLFKRNLIRRARGIRGRLSARSIIWLLDHPEAQR